MGLFKRKPKAHKIDDLGELKPMLSSGRPVLIDFYQVGCAPCQVMDGIVNELAREYGESAHIVKADIGRVPGAVNAFGIRSTPTLVLLGKAPEKTSKKTRKRAQGTKKPRNRPVTQRWRTSGLVKKDQLERVLESNGASKATPQT
jgi:thiol-disulfide isomerase/thioredoxin